MKYFALPLEAVSTITSRSPFLKPFLILLLLCLVGCGPTLKSMKYSPYEPGTVLVLPARDVVQGGSPHPKGAGSGKLFANAVTSEFQNTAFQAVETDNPAFGGESFPSLDMASDEARRKGARYVLRSELGEFRDAAPMTFRPDFVTLNKAVLSNVDSGQTLWELQEPFRIQSSNLGSYKSQLREIAHKLVEKVSEETKG